MKDRLSRPKSPSRSISPDSIKRCSKFWPFSLNNIVFPFWEYLEISFLHFPRRCGGHCSLDLPPASERGLRGISGAELAARRAPGYVQGHFQTSAISRGVQNTLAGRRGPQQIYIYIYLTNQNPLKIKGVSRNIGYCLEFCKTSGLHGKPRVFG